MNKTLRQALSMIRDSDLCSRARVEALYGYCRQAVFISENYGACLGDLPSLRLALWQVY
jgi:hypothetical protein